MNIPLGYDMLVEDAPTRCGAVVAPEKPGHSGICGAPSWLYFDDASYAAVKQHNLPFRTRFVCSQHYVTSMETANG